MAGYARQSSSSIADGEVITAAPLNSEFDALLAAFAFSGGHNHDGTSTEGAYVGLIADVDALNKIVVDTSNNRHGFFVEVSSSAVEQLRIQDGAIVPVTDSDIDLGTSSLEFKDLYIDGTAYIDTLEVHVGASLSAGVLTLPDGSASAPVITNASDTNQGLYFSGTDEMSYTAGGTAQVTFADGAIKPVTDNDIDLGTSSLEFKNLYIDGTANIDTLAATTMSGDLAMGSNKVTGLAAPTADGDAARKVYVDDSISSAEGLTQLAGNIDVNGYYFYGDASEQLTFKPGSSASVLSTQDSDGEFVALVLRNESDAADTTGIASLRFDLEDTGGNTVDAAKIAVKKEQSFTATASTQDSKIVLSTSLNGTLTEYLALTSAGALLPVTDNTVDIGSSSYELKDIYVDGTAYLDAIGFGTTSITLPTSDGSANQILKTNGSGTLSWTDESGSSFVLEDDDGTEVTVAADKEVKFIGSGLTTNWTDTDNGTDGDPYDLTFTVDAAQTGITSITNASLVIGRDADNDIDFGTDNTIIFRADGADQVKIINGAILPVTDDDIDLGSGTAQFKDAYFDGTVEADAITVGGTNVVTAGAVTSITSLLATDIKIGEDDQTKIDFETADEIHFYAANVEQVYLADNIFGPQTDSDVDLGTTGVRWKDAYIDSVTVTDNLTVGGNLTINGTTTTVNSTTVTIDDPIFTLGGDSAPGTDDNKDRGIEFRWHNGSAAKVGFFGYDDSVSAFTFIPDASNSSEVFSGTVGDAVFGNITGTLATAAQTNITSVGALDGGSITSGFGTIDTGSSNITTTGLISGGSLDIDDVLINGTTIGHTDDTDLLTLASGALTVAGTIEGTTITASTALVPDASGGADLGTTSLEWGDLYIADDKKIYLGSDQNFSIEYDEDGNDTTAVVAANGVSFAPHGTSAGNGTELRFQELAANGANYVGFKAPDSISSNEVWVLPNADGTDGQFLKTDGSNTLSWGTVASAGTTTLVADGAISNGQPVVVTSAGKAAQVTGTAARIGGLQPELVHYPTGQNTSYSNSYLAVCYDSDTDRFVFMCPDVADESTTSTSYHHPISKVVWLDSNPWLADGNANRMSTGMPSSSGVVSQGTDNAFTNAIYDTISDKVFVVIAMATSPEAPYLFTGTVTGGTTNTISWATPQAFAQSGTAGFNIAGGGGEQSMIAIGTVSSVNYFVWAGKNRQTPSGTNSDWNAGVAAIGELNGSTGAVTWNSSLFKFDEDGGGQANQTQCVGVCFDAGAGKFVMFYNHGAYSSTDRDPHMIVATPSGTGSTVSLAYGTAVEITTTGFYGGGGRNTVPMYDSDIERTILFTGQGNRVSVGVVTISGTTPTMNNYTEVLNEDLGEGGISVAKNTELSTSTTAIYEMLVKTTDNEIYMINLEITGGTQNSVGFTNDLGTRKYDIVGTTDANHYVNGIVHGSPTSTDDSCGMWAVFGDGNATAADYNAPWGNTGSNQQARPTGVFRISDVAYSTNLTSENFIGIANANYTDGQTATIQIAGSRDDAQSSLTRGQIYYVNPTGGLSLTQGHPKIVAGVADSTSSIVIAGVPLVGQQDTRIFCGSYDFLRDTTVDNISINLPSNIPESQVKAYEIDWYGVSFSDATGGAYYLYAQPLNNTSNILSTNTWDFQTSYMRGTSESHANYSGNTTGIACGRGGQDSGVYKANTAATQTSSATDEYGGMLTGKAVYVNSRYYPSFHYEASWRDGSGQYGFIQERGIGATDGETASTNYASGFKFYTGNASGTATGTNIVEGVVSVYAIMAEV